MLPDMASTFHPFPGAVPEAGLCHMGLKACGAGAGGAGAAVAFVTQGPSEGDERGACVLETQVHRLCSRIRAGNVDTRSQRKHTSVLLIT